MGRRKNANKLPPFIPMVWEMLNSRAYKDLPPSAAKALPFFLGKIKVGFRDTQRYQIEFCFSYGEAERFGFAPATFSKIIKALISFGFIDPVDKGGLRGLGRSFNFFKLSERWEKYGNSDFEELSWRCFLPRLNLKL